jgi:hypothetical protein
MQISSVKRLSTRLQRHTWLRSFLAVTILLALTGFANANDTAAELATGGLVFAKNDSIEMVSEDLYISASKIDVHYRLLNKSNSDITVLVAFPLPDLKMDPDDDVTVIPSDDPVNFVDFSTTVDGEAVRANVEQKTYLNGGEVTGTLMRLGIPLSPYRFRDAFQKYPANRIDQLRRLGLVNDGGIPLWTLKTTFYWQQRFQSGRQIVIGHQYKPSVGGVVPVESAQLLGWFRGPFRITVKEMSVVFSHYWAAHQEVGKIPAAEALMLAFKNKWPCR